MARQRKCKACGKPTTGHTMCARCYRQRGSTEKRVHLCACGKPKARRDSKICRACWKARPPEPKRVTLCVVCQKAPVSRGSVKGTCKTCYNAHRHELDPTAAQAIHAGDDPTRDRLVARLQEDVSRYKGAYDKTVKAQAAEERLIDLFSSSISRYPPLPAAVFATPSVKIKKVLSPEVPVLVVGDQHVGESIAIEETFGINAYSFDVYQSRLEYLEDRVVDILTDHQQAPFDQMVVLSMGDNISGVIHEELQRHGHQHIIDQVYLGALTSALFLYRLLRRLAPRGVKKLRVSCVSGNHGRTSKDKDAKKYYKNFDYLFHSLMASVLRDVPEIEFHIPRCLFTVVEIADHRVLQSHGHELPPSSLGIPLYSINRASASYQELLAWSDASRFDYWVLGHFHRPMELDNTIVNGTMAGISEFGLAKFKPIRPVQKLLGFHQKYGKSWEYQVRLDHAPKRPKVYTFATDMPTDEALALYAERQRTA